MNLLEPQFGLLLYTLLLLVLWLGGILFLILVVWRRNDLRQSTKISWSFFFVLIPLLAFIGYFVFGRKKEIVS
jgi:cell division protein FtsW (lipid II flippase)